MNSESSENDESRADDANQRIEELGDQFLDLLRLNSNANWQTLVDQHSDLAPDLESRLKLLEAVFRATRSSSRGLPPEASDSDEFSFELRNQSKTLINSRELFPRNTSRRISCPHCGNVVQLVTDRIDEVTCGSCGSSVKVVEEATQTDLTAIPKTIGRFKILRLLGSGAFGSVYLADDPNLRRRVAVKVPRQGFFMSAEEEQRFFREAQSAAKLQHPNIVSVYEISHQYDAPYIVSEFIDGLTLSDVVSSGLLSFKEIAELMVQICNAVEHAHRNGVIHRDLKPSNILVDHNRTTYVTDFGLARRDDAEITMTVDGVILGTPAYMSPEQATGMHASVDARSDVYSLGVMLYKMLCKELPFTGTKRMLLHQVIHDEPRIPSKLNDNIPIDLETITLRAMAKSKNARYQSAGEIAEELGRWLRGESIHARRVSSLSRFWRLCLRHPTVASLCAAIALILLAGLIYGWYTAGREIRLRGLAETNAKLANENKAESESRLHQIYTQNGLHSLQSNELNQSGFWLSKALELEDNVASRVRLGMILDQMPKLMGLYPVGSEIQLLKYNDNGTRLAIGTKNGRLLVFNTVTHEKILDQSNSSVSVFQVQFGNGGNRIAFPSDRVKLQVWDLERNRLVGELVHTDTIYSVEVNESGSLFATASFDSTIQLWNAVDGTRFKSITFENQKIRNSRFVADSKLILIEKQGEDAEKHELVIWNYDSDKSLAELTFEVPLHFDVSADGKKFVTSSEGKFVKVWETRTGKQLGETIESSQELRSAFLSSTSELVTLAANRSVISEWDLESGRREGDLALGFDPSGVVFDLSGQLIAVADNLGVARFLERKSGAEIASRLNHVANNATMAFHPDGRQIAIEGDDKITRVWNLAGGLADGFEFVHDGSVRNARFLPNRNACVSVGLDGKAIIHDTKSGLQIGIDLVHDAEILECDISQNGQLIVTVSADKTARIWDSATGRLVGKPMLHDAHVFEVAFNAQATRVVTGCGDGSVYCWKVTANAPEGDPQPEFKVTHEKLVRRVLFSPTDSLIGSASFDGTVHCWDATTGVTMFGPFKHDSRVMDFDFFPDGKQIVTGGSDGRVTLWNLADGKSIQTLECTGEVLDVGVSNEGLLTANDLAGTSRVWKHNGKQFELQSEMRNRFLPGCNFSTLKSNMVATSGGWVTRQNQSFQKGAVVLWSSVDGSPLSPPLFHRASVRRVELNLESNQLLTASDDGTSRLCSIARLTQSSSDIHRIMSLYYPETPAAFENQIEEFTKLSAAYPTLFRTSTNETQKWDRDFLHSSAKQQIEKE